MKHIGIGIGMRMIERIEYARSLADFFGMRFGDISLYPKDDNLPTYSRDACLFTGNLSEVENFLDGVRWARSYDKMIGSCTDQRRKQFEAKEVARLTKILYNKEKAETFKILKDKKIV